MLADDGMSAAEAQQSPIRDRAQSHCDLCGGAGVLAYAEMSDRFFGVPGSWNVARCTNRDCGALWLDPMPLAEDLPKAYQTYYTHKPAPVTQHSRALGRLPYLPSPFSRFSTQSVAPSLALNCVGLFSPIHSVSVSPSNL